MQPMFSRAARKLSNLRNHTCSWSRSASTSHFYTNPLENPDRLSEASLKLREGGPARTRFAPSPTVAKATGGQFLLRIEDTDQRTVPDAEEKIKEYLQWAGIQWDEGPNIGGPCGPYKQSERLSIYREHAGELLQSGHAYRCFCSTERLSALASILDKASIAGHYDRKCAHIPKETSDARAANGEGHVVRLRAPSNAPEFEDLVYGWVRRRNALTTQGAIPGVFHDPVVLKTDGFPTYHLANVVDDHLMKITHVIRGSEWLSSTQTHLTLYKAFGWEPPKFAHVCLLTNKELQKLSKRDGALGLSEYRYRKGIFPETLTNLVALLGWSHNERRDVMSMQELIKHASLKYTKANAVVSFEKLEYLQKRHATRYATLSASRTPLMPPQDLLELAVKPMIEVLDKDSTFQEQRDSLYHRYPNVHSRLSFLHSILLVDANNYTTPHNFLTRSKYFLKAPMAGELSSKRSEFKLRNVPASLLHEAEPSELIHLFSGFADIEDWDTPEIKFWISSLIDQAALRSTNILQATAKGKMDETETSVKKAWSRLVHGALRWAIQAGAPGPDGAETMRILGRGETMKRLKLATDVLKSNIRVDS